MKRQRRRLLKLPRRPRRTGHPRGSVTLFVVVTLALMTLLGVAYLQMARFERFAARLTTESHVDVVADAAMKQISDLMARDVVSRTSGLFLSDELDNEPYDYPWTSPPQTAPWVRDRAGNLVPNVDGGDHDDMWLAGQPFFLLGADPLWTHLTNLNGIFLRLPNPDPSINPTGSATDVQEDFVRRGSGNWWEADTNVKINSGLSGTGDSLNDPPPPTGTVVWLPAGADADGDGVLDSRWTWAPIRGIGGVTYVMAVRVIDNSALANFNVLTGLQHLNGVNWEYDSTSAGTDAPRWHFPTELDGLGPVLRISSAANRAAYVQEFRNLVDYRLGASPALSLPTPWDQGANSPSRLEYWLNGQTYYGNFQGSPYAPTAPNVKFRSLSITDELELRYRNGLNSPTVAQIEDGANGMRNFLRDDVTNEAPNTTFNTAPALNFSRYDTLTYPNATPAEQLQNWLALLEPRKHLTAVSGSAIYLPAFPNESAPTPPVPPNAATPMIKSFLTSESLAPAGTYEPSATRKARLVAAFQAMFNAFAPPAAATTFAPPAFYAYPGGREIENYAMQIAANVIDYADPDNRLTKIGPTANGDERYGMEALPFISEVYVQRPYSITTATTPSANGSASATSWDLEVTGAGTTHGYAIEIRNPFSKPIPIDRVYVYLNDGTNPPSLGGTDLAGLVGAALSTANAGLVPAAPTGHPNYLQPGQAIILYKNSTGGDATHDDIVNLLPTSLPGTYNWLRQSAATDDTVLVAVGDAWPTTAGTISVELRAEDDSGAQLNFPYCTFLAPVFENVPPLAPAPYAAPVNWGAVDTGSAVSPAGTSYVYAQFSRIGSGMGLNTAIAKTSVNRVTYETVASAPPDESGSPPSSAGTGLFYENVDRLKDPDKHTVATPSFPSGMASGPQFTPVAPVAIIPFPNTQQLVFNDTNYAVGGPPGGLFLETAELAHLAIIGPSATQTFADAWQAAPAGLAGQGNARTFMLPVTLGTRVGAAGTGYPNLEVPHAILAFDRFTNLSPARDGLDNDGNGGSDISATADTTELFIPGRMNINTITLMASADPTVRTGLLFDLLPLPDGVSVARRTSLINTLLAYRDNPLGSATFASGPVTARTAAMGSPTNGFALTNWRSNPGIAYMGEVFSAIVNSSYTNPLMTDDPSGSGAAYDTERIDQPGGATTKSDFLSNAEYTAAPPTNPTGDNIQDDAEEEAALARWLNQTFSTRSDIFTAFIYIRGYPNGDFSQQYVESRRLIVVFDRSRLADATSPVRILGVRVVE